MTRRAVPLAALVMLGSLVHARAARADDASSVAAATLLFDEGVKLMDHGRAEEACPKLARSQSLAPSGGTLLALGECYEKTGRVASAWLAYREAATRAAGAGKHDAETSSLERAKRLEPRLPRLNVTVPPASQTAGLEVRRDGAVMKEAELGVPVPFDPGPHEIQATAPQMKPFTKKVTLRPGETTDVAIPKLAPETAGAGASPPPVTEPPPADGSSPASSGHAGGTQRVVGIVVAGAGIASLTLGGVFGLLAKSKNDKALEPQNCPNATRCNPSGLELTDDAKSRALVSTILVAVGATAVVVGGIVFFTAPHASATSATAASTKTASSSRRLHVSPELGLGAAGAAASFVW